MHTHGGGSAGIIAEQQWGGITASEGFGGHAKREGWGGTRRARKVLPHRERRHDVFDDG